MGLDLINAEGFQGSYDFLYLPLDFKGMVGIGYSFINFINSEQACASKRTLLDSAAGACKAIRCARCLGPNLFRAGMRMLNATGTLQLCTSLWLMGVDRCSTRMENG